MPDVSDAAVRRATGYGWDHWHRVLDAAGPMGHPERALFLSRLGVPDWWCQMVAVGYEKARGLRVHGQTSTGDFQASAQRKFPVDADAAWEAVLAAPWLGVHAAWEEGAAFTGPEGERVEVRIVRPAQQLRFWRSLPGGKTTVEVSFRPESGGTAVRFMETGIPTAERNEAAKARWKQALDAVVATLGGGTNGATGTKGAAARNTPRTATKSAAKATAKATAKKAAKPAAQRVTKRATKPAAAPRRRPAAKATAKGARRPAAARRPAGAKK